MAALTMRMPGVYTQEIATLPPSVAAIASAVPVFIGYTEMAVKKGDDLTLLPTRIKSMKEYSDSFGGAPLAQFTVTVDSRASATNPDVIVTGSTLPYKMYHSLLFYFANGGGPCYIVSIGDYNSKPNADAMAAAIPAIKKVRDITIIYYTDGLALTDPKYTTLISETLAHCATLSDPNRVTIVDLNDSYGEDLDKIAKFLSPFAGDVNKKYGMVYGPSLDTVFTAIYAATGVIITSHLQTVGDPAVPAKLKALSDDTGAKYTALNVAADKLKGLQANDVLLKAVKPVLDDLKAANPGDTNDQLRVKLEASGVTIPADLKALLDVPGADPVKVVGDAITKSGTDIGTAQADLTAKQGAYAAALTTAKAGVAGMVGGNPVTFVSYMNMDLATIATISDLLANKIKDAIGNYGVVLPAGGAVAGIYFRTDAAQGPWKAPANVTVVGAISPMVDYDDDDHANMNLPDTGLAVNLIRNYPGRGVLLYGARTLAGNDNEWRYVNVRRTFCFIEDSIYRAMQDFVFAPNTSETWIKVRAMINAFLNKIWKAGGLFGATPEDAYDVTVGLPITMSVDDVLNGIMIVYIKVAVARPAEFILLIYEHKFAVPQS